MTIHEVDKDTHDRLVLCHERGGRTEALSEGDKIVRAVMAMRYALNEIYPDQATVEEWLEGLIHD